MRYESFKIGEDVIYEMDGMSQELGKDAKTTQFVYTMAMVIRGGIHGERTKGKKRNFLFFYRVEDLQFYIILMCHTMILCFQK